MFSNIGKFLFAQTPRILSHQPLRKVATQSAYWIRPLSQKLLLSTLPIYYFTKTANSRTVKCQQKFQLSAQNSQVVANRHKQQIKTLWEQIVDTMWHIVRFFQLWIIFIPPMLGFPLVLFKKTENLWYDLFVTSVERAGVVWIKAFQYLSHRRDIIGPEMAEKFVHLRENAPTHSYAETRRNFKKNYGKQIQEIFEEFDPLPLASGSVSQVYKAKYHGKKVAVKVRHPGVDKHIKRDINLLFFFSKLFALISYSFQIPISEDSMKRTLTEQIDFNIEKQNLDIFNSMFEGRKQIKFPFPFASRSSDSILVQTFVQGVPITYYQKNPHPLNAVMASIGATAFFEMLMKNNFIHADCHGGNIIVEVYDQSFNFFTQIWGYMKEKYYQLEQWVVESTFESDLLRKLYVQGRQEQAKVRNLLRKYKEKVRINIIDAGMVISLDQADRDNFVNFIKSVISSDGEGCAKMIYSLSSFDGKKIVQGKFNEYFQDLRELFSVINGAELGDLNGMKLLGGMLNIIRNYRMKLDGQFATLLTNMMVLEALAKDIDPQINILKCAIPYFTYVKDSAFVQSIAEKSLN